MFDPTVPFIPTGLLAGQSERSIYTSRVRFVPALVSGVAATAAFLALYYGSLGLLPSTYVHLSEYHPLTSWYSKLDLAQFFGTIISPPYATRLTWWLGVAALFFLLTATGVVFALLVSWSMGRPTPLSGILFGAGLFIAIAGPVSLGSGFNPAVMRQSVPDVGFFLLGWSGWATIQLLACSVAYGLILSAVYRRVR